MGEANAVALHSSDHALLAKLLKETTMPDAHALYDQADKLKDDGKLEEAAAKLTEALAAEPNYSLAHSALAVVLQRLGRHEEAIEHAQKVCDLDPADPFSFTALSVTFQRAFAGTQNMHYIRLAEDAMEKSRMLQSRR
jgi:tetratricopeptide (TPR) repeat protein